MRTAVLASASLAAVASAAVVGPGERRLLARRLAANPRRAPEAPRGRRLGWLLGGAVTAVMAVTGWQRIEAVVVAAVAAAAGLVVFGLRRRAAVRRSAAIRRSGVMEACDLLSAELRAGQPPAQALAHAARSWPELAPAATSARLGGDVPAALRSASALPGAASLSVVAAAWQVAHRTGAGLAGVIDRVGAGLREEDATRREVVATLAAPRATARLLAVLPVFGLFLGTGVGANPWVFLVSTPLGLLCLALGCALALGGLFWVDRLADAAER